MNTKIIKHNTPSYIVTALIYGGISLLISSGYTIPLYILIGLLSITTLLMTVISATMLQRDLVKLPESKNPIVQNLGLRFLVQMLIVMCIYQLYNAGFIFLAGVYSTTSAILVIGTIVRYSFSKEK